MAVGRTSFSAVVVLFAVMLKKPVISSSSDSWTTTCPLPGKTFRDPLTRTLNCYRLFAVHDDWPHARVACQLWNGDLATISSTAESAFVDSFWNSVWWRIWIGAFSTEVYVLNAKLEQSILQPILSSKKDDSHYPSHCVFLAGNMTWASTACNESYVFLCKRQYNGFETTTPTTTISTTFAFKPVQTALTTAKYPQSNAVTQSQQSTKAPVVAIHGQNLKPTASCAQYLSYGYIKIVEGVCFILGGTDSPNSDGFLSAAEAAQVCNSIPNGRLVTIQDNVQWLAVRQLHNLAKLRSPATTFTWVDLEGKIQFQSEKYWYGQQYGTGLYSLCSAITDTPVGFKTTNDTQWCAQRSPYICAVTPCPTGQNVVMGSGLDSTSDYACDDDYPCTYVLDRSKYACNSPDAGTCVDVNDPSRYKCLCNTGYSDPFSAYANSACVEVNDCKSASTCGQRSNSTSCIRIKNNACSCMAGYRLVTTAAGRSSCVDIDECSLLPPVCGPTSSGVCVNILGSYGCRCYGGYQHADPSNPWNSKCVDIRECDDPTTCGQNEMRGVCIEQPGDYQCRCRQGYQLAPQAWSSRGQPVHDCIVDQCAHTPFICGSANGTCVTLPYSYRCDCNWGYQSVNGGTACSDIDECVQTPNICGDPASGSCLNTAGSYRCLCNVGYQSINYGRQCLDIDECLLTPNLCGVTNGTCTNTPGSYRCNCFAGYQNINDGTSCVDIDECAQNPAVCGASGSGTCKNLIGSYYCACNAGFQNMPVKGATFTSMYSNLPCVDVAECSSPNACSQAAKLGTCTEIQGGYKCSCIKGYQVTQPTAYNGFLQCADVNECSQQSGICGNGATCTNLPGGYSCSCNTGWRTSANGACTEINQCVETPNICGGSSISFCSKYSGGHLCRCYGGYQHSIPGNPSSACVDISECSDRSNCGQNTKSGTCTNFPGGYSCTCAKGYKLVNSWGNNGQPVHECVRS